MTSPHARTALFVLGLVILIAVELLRWLAEMPAETATGLTGLAWLCLGGPPTLAALAARKTDERGHVRGGLAVLVLALGVFVVGLLAVGVGGCAPRHVVAEQSVEVDIQRGPPCLIVVKADGELVARVDWSRRCEVSLPEIPQATPQAPADPHEVTP